MLPHTYAQLYKWLKENLAFRENGENESRWLLEEISGKKILVLGDEEISIRDFAQCHTAIERLENGEPFQYVMGSQDFFGLNFKVNADVLVPRPETEILVQTAIEWGKDEYLNVLDLCTGSGCIIISLAKNLAGKFHAADISPQALKIAKENAALNKVKVKLYNGDLFKAVPQYMKFDIITANPPYLTKEEMANIPKELTFEPDLALYGGDDGLSLCYKILKEAPQFMKTQGLFLMEIGENQGGDILKFAQEYFKNTQIIKDLCGKDRFLKAEN
ncbi:MAG: peptide chain release factor N(5)-glutamine methyltransferase [Clostridiales bacterium]